jgi:hypothetical protein
MSWVPIHESALADSVDFGFSGEGVTFADSIVSQSEWNTFWWIALPTDPELPLLRVSVVDWAGAFSGMGPIVPLSWGFRWEPGFITSQGDTLDQVANESATPDSEWVPSPIQIEFPSPQDDFAIIQFMYFGESEPPTSAQWLIEVWVDDPPPPPEPEPCEEHGRVTRAYVSGYQRDRIHRSRLLRGERRCLVANFNGAIPRCRTIARVIWRCDQNQAVYMENARIVREGREVAVDITAQIGWGARVKCEAVLDNGEVYTQLFVIRVVSPPYFMGEPTWYAPGPTELVATA